MMIWAVRQEYVNVSIITLSHSVTILMFLYTSIMCYQNSAMLNYNFPNLSTTFSNSIFSSITHITNHLCPYNLITLFKILLQPTWYMFDIHKLEFYFWGDKECSSAHKYEICHERHKILQPLEINRYLNIFLRIHPDWLVSHCLASHTW